MGTRLTKEQALQKAKHYCAYQERSHKEVRNKLYEFGLYKNEVEELIATLIEEDYLNEERFALAIVKGKFNINKWGKIKIKQALTEKQVSPYNIKKAMQAIDEDEYLRLLEKLAKEKWRLIKDSNPYIKKQKLKLYLLQKGFESNLVLDVITSLQEF